MNIEELYTICQHLNGVTTDIKWEDHLCFNVGAKMFLITSPDNVPPTASFKCTEEKFAELTTQIGFTPAPYLARYHWVYVDDINRLDRSEWKIIIDSSYKLVASKLPKKLKKQLNISY